MIFLEECVRDVVEELLRERRGEAITGDMVCARLRLRYPRALAAVQRLLQEEITHGRDPELLELESLKGQAEQAFERGDEAEGRRLLAERLEIVTRRHARAYARMLSQHVARRRVQ